MDEPQNDHVQSLSSAVCERRKPLKEGPWVQEIAPNRRVVGVFLAKEKKALKGKTGKPYLLLRLTDRTGEVEGRIWDRVEELGSRFQAGDIVGVSGEAVSYQGTLQVRVMDIQQRSGLDDRDLPTFVPEYDLARKRSEERFNELLACLENIQDPALRGLVEEFLQDPDLREGWLMAPAAKKLHHARLGGLLEHTLSVWKLAMKVCSHYPHLQRDLILAGAVIHDVGKIRELQSPWRPDYTTEGRLLGHVMIGAGMLEKRLARREAFPPEQAMALRHMLISHHGQFEYGAPRRPKTLEALMLYMLDDLDAKFDAFHQHLVTDEGGEEGWTSFHPLFDRYLYRGGFAPDGSEISGGEIPLSDEADGQSP
jgi:3'-5' exoribonuclease